jgi:hypothetical protein
LLRMLLGEIQPMAGRSHSAPMSIRRSSRSIKQRCSIRCAPSTKSSPK